MKNGMIKLLGAVTLATTPMVSLVACGGTNSEIASDWMENLSSITVNVKTTATDADKKKAADAKIKNMLKSIGLKVSGEIKYNADFTTATFKYTLNKETKEKTIEIKYSAEQTATEKAITALSPTYAVNVSAEEFEKEADLKTKAENKVKEALGAEKDNVNFVIDGTVEPDGTDKKIVSITVNPKTGKGQETTKKVIKVTMQKQA